jgi:hypothetical protein
MIVPTVGRMIWFNPSPEDRIYSSAQVLAAIVAGVNDDGTVNLAVFRADGSGPYHRQNVAITGPDSLIPEGAPGTAMWMPYQKGQAAKAEELEKKLTGEVVNTTPPASLTPIQAEVAAGLRPPRP